MSDDVAVFVVFGVGQPGQRRVDLVDGAAGGRGEFGDGDRFPAGQQVQQRPPQPRLRVGPAAGEGGVEAGGELPDIGAHRGIPLCEVG